MHILITGGAGYIGSHIVKALLEQSEHTLVIVDNLSTGKLQTIQTLQNIDSNKRMSFYQIDLKDFDAIEALIEKHVFDAIIHLAASIVVPESIKNPLKYYMNNTVNTTHLIECALKYNIPSFIFSSTAAVYGESDKPYVNEKETCSSVNPYGRSKLMSEITLMDAAKSNHNFNYTILRYFNVAGASLDNTIGQCFPDATHLIKVAAECAAGKRENINIYGDDYNTRDGTCIRDFIHVEDLASAHIAALNYLDAHKKSHIFNCGYAQGYTVKEVIETMKNVSNTDFIVNIAPRREGDLEQLVCDNTKILKTLDWKPQFNDLTIICKTALNWEKNI